MFTFFHCLISSSMNQSSNTNPTLFELRYSSENKIKLEGLRGGKVVDEDSGAFGECEKTVFAD